MASAPARLAAWASPLARRISTALLDVALGLGQRLTAGQHAGPRAVAQRLDVLGGDLGITAPPRGSRAFVPVGFGGGCLRALRPSGSASGSGAGAPRLGRWLASASGGGGLGLWRGRLGLWRGRLGLWRGRLGLGRGRLRLWQRGPRALRRCSRLRAPRRGAVCRGLWAPAVRPQGRLPRPLGQPVRPRSRLRGRRWRVRGLGRRCGGARAPWGRRRSAAPRPPPLRPRPPPGRACSSASWRSLSALACSSASRRACSSASRRARSSASWRSRSRRARSSSARNTLWPCDTTSPIAVCHRGTRTDRVVVARDHVVDPVGIAVGVDQADDRDPQALRLADRDRLGLEVDHEHRVGHALHVLDAAEVRAQLLEVGLRGHPLAGGQQLKLALGLVALQVVQPPDPERDRLEVRQQPAEPAVVDVRHVGALRRAP